MLFYQVKFSGNNAENVKLHSGGPIFDWLLFGGANYVASHENKAATIGNFVRKNCFTGFSVTEIPQFTIVQIVPKNNDGLPPELVNWFSRNQAVKGKASPSSQLPAIVERQASGTVLEGMIGVDDVRKSLETILTGVIFRQVTAQLGANIPSGFNNFIISGLHGVGKTTIARSIADSFKAHGILGSKDPVDFITASQFVGMYVGHSQDRLMEKLKHSIDGILIIDEIDSWLDVAWYGKDLINALNAHMGNSVNKPFIIATCYASKYEAFMKFNEGLPGRFRNVISLKSYSDDLLIKIFCTFAERSKLICDAVELAPILKNLLLEVRSKKGTKFGNAREIENIFAATVDQMAARFAKENAVPIANPSEEARIQARERILRILPADLPDYDDSGYVPRPARSETINASARVVVPLLAPRK